MALAHFRPAPRAFLEMLEIAILLAGQADKDKADDFKTQRFAVQFGVIAANIPAFSSARMRRRQSGAVILARRDSSTLVMRPVCPQLRQDTQVDRVNLREYPRANPVSEKSWVL